MEQEWFLHVEDEVDGEVLGGGGRGGVFRGRGCAYMKQQAGKVVLAGMRKGIVICDWKRRRSS